MKSNKILSGKNNLKTFESLRLKKEKENEDMKKAVFEQCISKYGGKTEAQMFQTYALVQQEYVKKTGTAHRFESDVLLQIKKLGKLKAKNERCSSNITSSNKKIIEDLDAQNEIEKEAMFKDELLNKKSIKIELK